MASEGSKYNLLRMDPGCCVLIWIPLDYVKPWNPYDDTLPFPIALSVGFSLKAGLVMCIVSVVVSMAPIVLALRKLSSGMNNMGNNSLALSAACHASTLSAAVKHHRPSTASHPTTASHPSFYRKALSASNRELTPSSHESESAISRHGSDENRPNISRDDSNRPFLPSTYEADTEKTLSREEQTLLNVSRSRIRWGVIRMPPEWYRDYETSAVPVEHLSFGVEEDGVEPPVTGKHYA